MTTGQVIKSNKVIISKRSLRELTKQRRLPSVVYMYLAGAWLLDLLRANSLEEFRLMHMAYWVRACEVTRTQMILTWRPAQ
jgi:hypothetical protein